MTEARTQVIAVLAAAAVVLALIVTVSPHATLIANEASGEIYGVDILGLTKKAVNLVDQEFPTH
jgi:hypothetical protein